MCRCGVDCFMYEWFERFDDSVVLEILYLVDWDFYGKVFGFVCNQEMVDVGMNVLMVWVNLCLK